MKTRLTWGDDCRSSGLARRCSCLIEKLGKMEAVIRKLSERDQLTALNCSVTLEVEIRVAWAGNTLIYHTACLNISRPVAGTEVTC